MKNAQVELSETVVSLVHNERTKLSATWLNGVAIAAVAVGAIAPSIAAFAGTMSVSAAAGLAVFWLILGIGLHFAGRALLGLLKDLP